MATKVIFLTTTGAGTWTVPSDWTSTNKVETIGGGGGGRVAAAGGGGGGGGAYSSVSNIGTFTPGTTVVNFSVGAAGTAGVAGGDTWFGATTLAASLVGSKGGSGATTSTGATGGASASGFPTSGGVRNSGGAGGLGNATVLTGGGGGGAAGPGGVGGTGGAGDATAAGADFGGGGGSGAGSTTAGGNGGAGTTAAGAGGTNATGGGSGGAGGSGAGVAATAATGLWTSTHAANGTTVSVVGAATGGGGGGGGSAATGSAGAGAAYGGGGGGVGVTTGGASAAGQGIIIITYTYTIPRTAKRFRYNLSDLTRVWQDSAKTTAGAVDSPIGYVADAYGTGLDVRQTTSTKRPILRLDSGLNRYYAEFDGVDDFLESVIADSLNLDEFVCFVFAGENVPAQFPRALSAKTASGSDGSSTGALVMYFGWAGISENNFTLYLSSGQVDTKSPNTLTSPASMAVYEAYKTPTSASVLYDGVEGTPDTTFTTDVNTETLGYVLGAGNNGTASFLNGRIYSAEFDGTSGISSGTRDTIRAFHSTGGVSGGFVPKFKRSSSSLGTRVGSRQPMFS